MDSNIPFNRNIYICTECGTVETYIVSENGGYFRKKILRMLLQTRNYQVNYNQ
ncbi:hypothetical protein ALC53_09801 [Atta colombica]|uniref:Uncharacterized protein n=1 Tax=Atta colombica TaxID=520822 RepID=A0A195B5G5_9HYME|nr:hypothetical protein ALC53_09801 [Atta colombica]